MDRPYPRIDTYAWVALALATALVALYHLGLDLAWAATVVPGGTEKLGDGIKDAAKTAEIGLIGYLGPIASVAAGLITALATRQAGGSNAGAAAGGVAAAGIVAFIPVAGTTTYTTSGSAAADFGSLIGASGATPVNRDLFALLTIMLFFAAITWLRHARARHAR